MDERDLRIFLNLSSFSSIREAGRNLYLTQPSLSMHIKKLEKEVGAQLIYRNRNGFEFTSAGKQLLGFAPVFIALCEEIRQRTAMEPDTSGGFKIGATSSLSIFLLGPVLGDWAVGKSQYNLTVAVGRHLSIINDTLNGRICMGLVRTLPKDAIGIKSTKLGDEKILCIESVVNKTTTSIASMSGKTFFCPASDNVLWQAVNKFIENNQIKPKQIFHIATAEARVQAVLESEDTIAFVPKCTVNYRGNKTSTVRTLDIIDAERTLTSPVFMIWRQDRYPRELNGLIAALKHKFQNQALMAS